MNFPERQKIGRLGEIDVERLFTTWSWTVGRDHIDTGYDLNIEPDVTEFGGNRFLAQVKSTEQKVKSGKIVAPVEKSRLRQYAQNPIPVFLIRSSPEGKLHWLHVQAWAERNVKRLTGNGETGIKIPNDQSLDDKESFVNYLRHIFRPAAEDKLRLANIAKERSAHLSSIDPNFLVRVGLHSGAESYEILAKSTPAKISLDITPAEPNENQERLMDAIRYGLPAEIKVDTFRIKGSPLFTELGLDKSLKGVLTLRPESPQKGTVSLYPGETYSILATALSLSSSLYRGQGGVAINNNDSNTIFRVSMLGGSSSETTITLGFDHDQLLSSPIQQITELANIGDWAREVLNKESMRLDVMFAGKKISAPVKSLQFDQIRPVLVSMFWLGRLHKIARALDSDLTLDRSFSISQQDEAELQLAYWILKGERRAVKFAPIEVNPPMPISVENSSGDFYMETAIALTVGGRYLGTLPIAVDLGGYHIEKIQGTEKYLLSSVESSSTLMYHNENGATDATIFRKE